MEQKLQCVVSDLDDSLLTSDKTISPRDRETIRRLKEKGVYFFIASGRHFSFVRELASQVGFDLPVICCNGGHVYDYLTGETLMAKLIPSPVARAVKEYLDERKIHYLIYTTESPFFTPGNPRIPFWEEQNRTCAPENRFPIRILEKGFPIEEHRILKFLVPQATDPIREDLTRNLNQDGSMTIVYSGKGLLDLNAAGACKGAGIEFLSQHFGFSLENTMAMGDSENDQSMLDLCGWPVVPENGEDFLKGKARFVTAHHDRDPLTAAIQHLFPQLLE